MSLNRAQRERHALRIAREVLENVEFSYVYEDDQLLDADEDDQIEVHDLVLRQVRVSL